MHFFDFPTLMTSNNVGYHSAGVYIFLFDQKYGQITCWGKKMIERGRNFFSSKLQKKRPKFFACGAHPLRILNFVWGKCINQGRVGGQNMNFKYIIHPCHSSNGGKGNKPEIHLYCMSFKLD